MICENSYKSTLTQFVKWTKKVSVVKQIKIDNGQKRGKNEPKMDKNDQ